MSMTINNSSYQNDNIQSASVYKSHKYPEGKEIDTSKISGSLSIETADFVSVGLSNIGKKMAYSDPSKIDGTLEVNENEAIFKMPDDEGNNIIVKKKIQSESTTSSAVDNTIDNFDIENTEDDALSEYQKRMDAILNKIASGETVSSKDREWLDGELQSIMSGHYKGLVDLKLERKDVLNELADNVLQRKRLFNDMLKQTDETGGIKAIVDFDFLQDEFDIKSKEELIEQLTKALEDDDDDQEVDPEEDEKSDVDESVENNEQPIKLNHDSLENEKRASNIIDTNKDSIDAISKQSNEEINNSKHYSKLLNDRYSSINKMLEEDDFSYEDKAAAVKEFLTEGQEIAHSREVERLKGEYDRETVIIARRFMQLHDDFSEVIRKNNDFKPEILTQDIVLNLLNK